jgi:hypothetical protein
MLKIICTYCICVVETLQIPSQLCSVHEIAISHGGSIYATEVGSGINLHPHLSQSILKHFLARCGGVHLSSQHLEAEAEVSHV